MNIRHSQSFIALYKFNMEYTDQDEFDADSSVLVSMKKENKSLLVYSSLISGLIQYIVYLFQEMPTPRMTDVFVLAMTMVI